MALPWAHSLSLLGVPKPKKGTLDWPTAIAPAIGIQPAPVFFFKPAVSLAVALLEGLPFPLLIGLPSRMSYQSLMKLSGKDQEDTIS